MVAGTPPGTAVKPHYICRFVGGDGLYDERIPTGFLGSLDLNQINRSPALVPLRTMLLLLVPRQYRTNTHLRVVHGAVDTVEKRHDSPGKGGTIRNVVAALDDTLPEPRRLRWEHQ